MKKEVNRAEVGILRFMEQGGWQQRHLPPCAVSRISHRATRAPTVPGVLQGQGTQGWG